MSASQAVTGPTIAPLMTCLLPPSVCSFFIPTKHHCECNNHFQSHATIARNTECIPSSHSKSSCSRCSANDLQCVFPPSVRNMPHDKDHVRFSRKCVFCAQSHHHAGLLAPICQSAAGVLSIVSRVFLHDQVSSIPIIILLLPFI